MHMMAERGVIKRLDSHWRSRKPQCLQNSVSIVGTVSLGEFYPAFVAFGIGILCSLIVLVIEIYIKRITSKRQSFHYPYVD